VDSDYPHAEHNSAFIDQLEKQNGGVGILLKAKLLVQCDYSGKEKNGTFRCLQMSFIADA
jgi:hypothetical protein